MRQLLRIRMATPVAGAVLCGLVLAGCSGAGDTPSGGSGRTTASAAYLESGPYHGSGPASDSGPSPDSVASPVSGPWRAWTTAVTAQEASGTCGATAHQVVCTTGSGGFVGRSRSTGEITWTVPASGHGRSTGLVVDAPDERAVTAVGAALRAANLRTGAAAWTHRLSSGRSYLAVDAADGVVHTLDAPSGAANAATLGAVRASDGSALWHRTVAASRGEGIAAFGHRVYTTDGTRVTARGARTGEVVATSPRGTECQHLISGGHYLVCTGTPLSAGDTFPPLRRLDPVTLAPLPTAKDTGMKPERGLISADGVLVLKEDSAEDPGGGSWNAYDLLEGRRLWSYDTTTEEAGLVGGRFVTLTPVYDAAVRGRVITIDLHAGPQGTGTAAPRMSAPYPQTREGENPVLVVPGGAARHVVVRALTHPGLRSIPLP